MPTVEILYIILAVCVVVITVTIVWFANEAMKLIKSLRKSSDDVAFMTQEVKDKVLIVTEALDRAGTAATNIIGLVEDAVEGIKEKRDQLSSSIGLVAGVGDYFKKKSEKDEPVKEEKKPEPKPEVKKEVKETKDEESKEEEFEKVREEEAEKEEKKSTKEDLESAKPIKKEVAEKPKE